MNSMRFGLLSCAVLIALAIGAVSTAQAQVTEPHPVSVRIGYSVSGGSDLAAEVLQFIGAGSYLDWRAQANPPRPNGMDYIQMVRLHQNLTCGIGSELAWDRARCPYSEPHAYTVQPSLDQITSIAAAAPESIWLIGNEIDRRDWNGGRQDEMLPELYARAYHEIHTAIKAGDPSAQVGIGGVIQPTPLRLRYLDRILDAHKDQFGVEMPIDIWNVHNFILREVRSGYGADIPPGMPPDSPHAVTYTSDWTHVNMALFKRQIREFRRWMAERGQQQKPLVVSEYGVLYFHCAQWRTTEEGAECTRDFNDAEVVIDFMLATFDFFLNTKDCSVGYAADECRLVQRWIWFSPHHASADFNQHASLYDGATNQLTPAGEAVRDWIDANREELADPLPAVPENSMDAPRLPVEESQPMDEERSVSPFVRPLFHRWGSPPVHF